ncbi:MAG: type transport system ATP-binding protein [Nocardioidaceae bacterium]|nr:type transport system ATP-binding protein [Nocardioidaceae bacterium]
MALIEARGLAKTYGGKPAVQDLSFEVRPGSVTGFLGPNGAGKSTTMRLMLELDHGPGSTTFDGKPFHALRQPMRHVGALLEAKPFHPTRKARSHLLMLAAANGVPASRVDEVLRLVGLTEVARKKPKTFSLGMGQRLGLAGALLGDPHTLILDEPANGLDPQGIQWMRQFLKALAAEGRSVFVSSHLLSEMALLADQLVVIGRGRMISSGPVAGFIDAASHKTVLVRTPQADDLRRLLAGRDGVGVDVRPDGAVTVTGLDAGAIGDLAFDNGVRLHELAPQAATLEEAFLAATEGDEEFHAAVLPPTPGRPEGPA